VRQINTARKVVTRKVDLLCHDLIGAYGELSRQLYQVRTQEGFKNFVDGANGLEQLLCRAMDYLMRQCGHCNMAMWLAGKERRFQLGAYMKYRIPGQKALIDAMEQGVVRLADREGFIRVSEDGSKELLTDEEMDYLSDQDVMAINCTYLGETLAVLVMFRDAAKGFTDADAAVLKAISPLLAISLAAVVRRPREESGNGGNTTREEAEDQASADADWWKKGEPPPF